MVEFTNKCVPSFSRADFRASTIHLGGDKICVLVAFDYVTATATMNTRRSTAEDLVRIEHFIFRLFRYMLHQPRMPYPLYALPPSKYLILTKTSSRVRAHTCMTPSVPPLAYLTSRTATHVRTECPSHQDNQEPENPSRPSASSTETSASRLHLEVQTLLLFPLWYRRCRGNLNRMYLLCAGRTAKTSMYSGLRGHAQ